MSNKNCGPDIVKYFVVEPVGGTVTGSTGDFYVCSGTTFVNTISGCTDSVNFNNNIFYNNGQTFFSNTLSACTGIYTSNLYGCSPITVHDNLILLSGLTFNTISSDNSLTQILVRDGITGEVKYRDVSSITPDTNTFVTGGTYNFTTDIITLTRNDGGTIDITGVTDNFVVAGSYSDVTDTISLLRQDGSFVNITGVTDTFTTGATYDNGTALVTFTKNDGTSFTLDLSTIDVNDTFVTGGTLSGNDLILEKNNGVDVNPIDLSGLVSGKTDLSLFNSHTGDTNNPHQTSFSNLTSTAHTHTISDVINLQTELDSKLNVSDFNTYSGNVQTQIDSKLDITTFNTYTGNTQSILDTKISGGTNLSTTGIFAQKNGLDLEFKGLTSTGGTVNISSNSNTVNLEVTIPTDQDKFVSGGTYNTGTQEINFVGNSPETTFDVDLSSIISVDTYVTGFTFNPSTYDLTIKQNEGQPDLVSNLAVLASDVYVVSGVYNPATGIVTYTNSSGGTFQVSGFTTGMTDSYTTAANLNGETIEFDNNIQGSNLYSVSLTPILSGKTDLTLFNSHTGDTTIHYTKSSINLSELGSTAHTHTLSEITDFNSYSGNVQTQIDNKTDLTLFNSHTGDTNNPHQTSFGNLTSTAHTHTISDVTNLQSELDSKLNISDFNVYSGNVETQINSKTDLTLFNSHTGDTNNPHQTSFSNLSSTAHTHTLSEITDFNTYSGNVQTQLDTKIENGINSGGTNEVFSGKSGTDLYFRTISGGSNTTISTIDDIIRVDVTIPPDTNTFVTGGTYNESTDTITLTRNDGNTIEITGVTDTFTTGGTYNDSTAIITFTKNDSTTYDVDLTSLPATDEVTIEVNSLNEIALKEVVEAPTGGTRTFDSFITITSGLTINNLGTGTSVNNLGIDINGNVVIGTTGGTDTNTFVTGGTYTTGTLTLDRNDGNSVLVTGFLTGNTLQEVLVNGNTSGGNDIIMTEGDDVVFNYGSFANYVNTNPLTANRNILFPDKDGTVALISDTTGHTENFYVTGGTFLSETLTLDRNDGGSVVVTGFTSQPSLNNGEIFVGDTGNTAQSVAMTGDVNIDNTGVTTIQPDSVTYDKMQDVTQASLLGSTIVSGGTVEEIPFVEQYISDPTIQGYLSNTSNWSLYGSYTGTTITGTFQGQSHYDDNYWFTAVDDNVWIRLIRG